MDARTLVDRLGNDLDAQVIVKAKPNSTEPYEASLGGWPTFDTFDIDYRGGEWVLTLEHRCG